MPCVGRLRVAVLPRGGSFRVHGLSGHPEAAVFAAGSLLSGGYDYIELSTLQGRVDVSVVLEEWDGPPPVQPQEWDETASALVYLRGYVAVGGDAAGRGGGLRLAGGVGGYRADVRAHERHAVARACDRIMHRFPDSHGPEFRAAEDELRGREAFLVRVWPAEEAGITPGVR